jgi:flagellar basal body-associated protein FliL
MKKKLLFTLPVLLLVVGAIGGYAFVMPHKAAAKPHLVGNVYLMPGQFTLNLTGGHYATLTVALLLPPTIDGAPADEPVIRAIVTDTITGQPESALIGARGRAVLEHRILSEVNAQTDATVSRVYFTDLAVQ